MKSSVVVGIVTYNPNLDEVKETLNNVKLVNLNAIVVDNNSNEQLKLKDLCQNKDIDYIQNEENYGVAKALNQIMERAAVSGYKWVLTLDQDTKYPFERLWLLEKFLTNDVGIIAPYVYDINSEEYILNKWKAGVQEISKCITSGSLTSVQAWNNVGKFDEYLFIDGVDFDFCKRLKLKNYKILINSDIMIKHQLGEYKYRKILGCFTVKYNWHSPIRTYYIVRNMIYLNRKYQDNSQFKLFLRLIKRFLEILVIPDAKKERMYLYIQAIKDQHKSKKKRSTNNALYH